MKSLGKKALSILRGIAPSAARALGGPYGNAAAGIVSKILGVKESEIENFVLSASPEQLLQLKTAEMEFEKWMADAGIREEQLYVEDRDSARLLAREKGQRVQTLLSLLYTTGYFFVLICFIFGWAAVKPEQATMITTLVGALTAPQLQILNFWFGSSKGSRDKTDALAESKNQS